MDQMIEDLKRQTVKNEQQIKKHKQQVAASIQKKPSWLGSYAEGGSLYVF
jgi:hypothetical protein